MIYHITESENYFTVTDDANYFAYIQNARKVHTLYKTEWTLDDIISYYVKYFDAGSFIYHDFEGRCVTLTPDYIKPIV